MLLQAVNFTGNCLIRRTLHTHNLFKVFLQIIKMLVILQVTTIKLIVLKCIVVSLLLKSALKLVVIGSVTTHFDRKISPSAHPHFCCEKKIKNRKIKRKSKQKKTINNRHLSVRVKSIWCTSNWVLESV